MIKQILIVFLFVVSTQVAAQSANKEKTGCDPNVTIPTSFTPNGDGVNEDFRVTFKDKKPEMYHLMVYNRWGELMFESDKLEEGWNGNEREKKTPAVTGVYMWILSFSYTEEGAPVDCTGSVTLLR